MKVLGAASVFSELKQAIQEFEQEAAEEMKRAAKVLQEELNKRTPVWSGESVRNYAWGVGQTASGVRKNPIAGINIGVTSRMRLGEEPRRPANEAAVMEEIESLKLVKLNSLTVTNNSPLKKWDLIDNGSAPSKERARNPGGVTKLAIQSTRRKLKYFK